MQAKEGDAVTLANEHYNKKVSETIEVTIDCAGVLAGDETVHVVGADSQTADDDDAVDLTITGKAKNASQLVEQGKRPIAAGKGIQFFAAGGTAGADYVVSISFTTTAGQTRDASVRLKVETG